MGVLDSTGRILPVILPTVQVVFHHKRDDHGGTDAGSRLLSMEREL